MNWSIIPARWSAPLLSLLRIVAGLLFIAHGVAKHLNFPPGWARSRGISSLSSAR